MNRALIRTDFKEIKLIKRGKVRDIYELDDCLLIVATDRISAFDVVMDNPIPDKGRILTQMSIFWFNLLEPMVKNHLIAIHPDEYPEPCIRYKKDLLERSMLVKKAIPLKIECIVRGYLAGSGWKEYKEKGSICGIPLPSGLKESDRLSEPIFTPSTKAEDGMHDENISFEEAKKIVGDDIAEKVRDLSIKIYEFGRRFAEDRGIIIADTKLEFGIYDGDIILIDEVLTPDSSRFWPMEEYEPGRPQTSFDKQFLRDYLESISWSKTPPPPELPPDIIEKTRQRYLEAYKRLTGKDMEV